MNNRAPSAAKGIFAFSLHAHLPFTQVAEGESDPKELLMFDALTDIYLPLIGMLSRLRQDRVPSRMTIAISPTLLAMLEDPRLPGEYGKYLNKHEICEAKSALARRIFFDECGGRLIERLRDLQDDGVLEIATCAATHSVLPLLKRRESMRAQVAVAVGDYRRLFGRAPRGIWLPDGAGVARVDEALQELGLQYVLVDAAPGTGSAAEEGGGPLRTLCGLPVYARNEALSQSLWSEDAEKFVAQLYKLFPQNPLLTAACDVGLFRHRWAGEAEWLESVFRFLYRDRKMECATYGELERLLRASASKPAPADSVDGDWGNSSHLGQWLRPNNDWIYRHLHYAEDRLIEAIRSLRAEPLTASQVRLLNQAARQLLLAQSGDWPGLLAVQPDGSYAAERIMGHLTNVHRLLDIRSDAEGSSEWLDELERRWPCFPDLHYNVFLGKTDKPASARLRCGSAASTAQHVLMLAWEYPPNVIGGLARAVCDLSRHLAALGHTVHVITRHLDGLEEEQFEDGVHVHRVKLLQSRNNGLEFADWVFQMNLAFADYASSLFESGYRIDAIHAHDWLVGTAAEALKRQTGLPLVTTIHATEYGRSLGKLATELQRHIFRLEQRLIGVSDRLIACSRAMVDEISRLFSLPPERIAMIPNGVDAAAAASGEEEADFGGTADTYAATIPVAAAVATATTADTLAACDLARDPACDLCAGTTDAPPSPTGPILFTIGRLVHEKGIHVLLAAMPAILARFPQARLIIAGVGPMQGELEALARPFGAAVQFAGFVDGAAKWRLYRQAAVSVFPSLYEPFGLVALEAMAAGSPVVAARTGGFAETIRHGSNGLLVQPGSADALAKAICRLLSEPALAARLAQRADRKIARQYGWPAIAASTAEVYTGSANKSNYRAAPSQTKDVIACPDLSSSETANF